MAQKTEKEETEFKLVAESITITPCINNCGVMGNPATKNMCQKCYTSSKIIENHIARTPRSVSPRKKNTSNSFSVRLSNPASPVPLREKRDLAATDEEEERAPVKRPVNRCSGCRKKVGLTGFRCRCGELFCADHRYSDRHDCGFDYKSAGREAIARENPIVKAPKIVRI